MLALVHVWVIASKELQELVVGFLRETLLENVDALLRSQTVTTSFSRAGQLAQSAFTDNDVEMVLEALEAEAVLAWQRTTALHLVLHQTNCTKKHWPIFFILPF
mmetsp:Transcript_119884/g.238691  ORF Transcript_119884/g.238691 Transcript_119884/m.238691 type:complete len:104 (-) Transcript_119884:1698-2009(-)